MLKGIDISSHNRAYSTNGAAFVFVKATEGRTYKNPFMEEQAASAEAHKRLLGFYHYARPENGNSAKQEAASFVKAVKPYIGRAVLALDYEGSAHGCGAQWAVDFIKEVKRLTGVLPMFYTSEAYLWHYEKVAKTGAGLWVAKYSTKNPNPAPWRFWAVWQYRSNPWDQDYFNGDRAAWLKYARVSK